MIGLPNPYVIGGAALLAAAGMGGSYLKGRSDGRAIVNAKISAAMVKATAELRRRQGVIDRAATIAATVENHRQTEVRSYHTESIRYVDRPAQRLACIDRDAGGLLDRATLTANQGATIGFQPTPDNSFVRD